MDPLSILAIFGPVIVEGFKAAISRWIAPDVFKPATIGDYLAMTKADLDRFSAIASAGGANLPSVPWVDATVKLMRPGAAMVILAIWGTAHLTGVQGDALYNLNSLAAAVVFYLFGSIDLQFAKRAELRIEPGRPR